MNIPPPSQLKPGNYVYTAGNDSDDTRTASHQVMRNNGCKSLRFELREQEIGAVLVCHGYIARMHGDGVLDV